MHEMIKKFEYSALVLIQNLHKGNFHHLFVARQNERQIREVAERLKAHAWKACILFTGYRGFESLPLCRNKNGRIVKEMYF